MRLICSILSRLMPTPFTPGELSQLRHVASFWPPYVMETPDAASTSQRRRRYRLLRQLEAKGAVRFEVRRDGDWNVTLTDAGRVALPEQERWPSQPSLMSEYERQEKIWAMGGPRPSWR